jgi:hypothetical protein
MTSKKKRPAPPSADEVRRQLIQWFYDQNKRGGAARKMRELCKRIKVDYGYKAPLVKEHLTLLVDLGYIHKDVVMTTVQTGQTTRDQPRVTYRINAKGIEFMEGKSQFSERERYPGINITATGGSSIVLGDGNVVNSSYRPLYEELDRLRQALADSTVLNDTSKLEASVSIETIKDQLALPHPDRTIVEKAWDTASKLCTTAALMEYAARLSPMVAALFA